MAVPYDASETCEHPVQRWPHTRYLHYIITPRPTSPLHPHRQPRAQQNLLSHRTIWSLSCQDSLPMRSAQHGSGGTVLLLVHVSNEVRCLLPQEAFLDIPFSLNRCHGGL